MDNKKLKTEIRFLKAFHGDCFIVKTYDSKGNPFNILIDGGTAATFKEGLKKEIQNLPFINLVILTHIDSDHIGGLIKYIKSRYYEPEKVGQFWFNSKNIRFIDQGVEVSTAQAITLEEELIEKGDINEKIKSGIFFGFEPKLPEGIEIEIVSPTSKIIDKLYESYPDLSEEFQVKLKDISIAKDPESQIPRGSLIELAKKDFKPQKSIEADIVNSSSIAFILRVFDCKVLFLGDSNPKVVEESLLGMGYGIKNKLNVDLVKVSHHGSINNTSCELLDIITCEEYLISTNGGSGDDQHPDRETIARIIYHPERVKTEFLEKRHIYFNYPLSKVEERAGEFIAKEDLDLGNWKYLDEVNQWSIHG